MIFIQSSFQITLINTGIKARKDVSETERTADPGILSKTQSSDGTQEDQAASVDGMNR